MPFRVGATIPLRETPSRGRAQDQPEAREGQAGRDGVAERPVVPGKPGNAGGGKGPWFKADAESNEVCEIGGTLGNSGYRQELRTAYHVEAKEALKAVSRNLPAGNGRSRWLRQLS
jgi:hypothetical protein